MDFIRTLLKGAVHHRRQTGRPFVTLSYAQSLDGCISARAGESLALSGRQSLTLTHQLRSGHDAILVGIGTVLSDNPRLNVRLVDGKSPRPIVVDSRLRLPLDCKLLKQNPHSPWIITREKPEKERQQAIETSGAQVISVRSNSKGQVHLEAMLEALGKRGINSLMVEGGSRIITNFLLDRLVDYLVLTVAPVMVGGLRAVSDLGQSDPTRFPRLRNAGHQWLGEDLILWGALA
jgi:riboflavin-specific deaminase-like protein